MWDTILPMENCDTPYCEYNLTIPQIFWNIEGLLTNFFGTVRPNFVDWKKMIPPFLSIKNFSQPEIFSKTVVFLYKSFRHWETKKYRRKIVTPILCIKFSVTENFWNIEGMPRNFFGTKRPKIFDRKTWYTLLYIKFSDTIIFSETLQGCSQNFSVLWDHFFPTEKCDTFHFFNHKNFRNQRFSQKQ